LWYLLWQRLSPQHTLAAVVADARRGGADALRPGPKRLSAQWEKARFANRPGAQVRS
jgi:hypothetical protein